MHILKRVLKNSIIRSLLGAGGGALVALLLYNAYQTGSDILAYIVPNATTQTEPSGQVQLPDASPSADSQTMMRIGMRAREIAATINTSKDAVPMPSMTAPASSSSSEESSVSVNPVSDDNSLVAMMQASSVSSAATSESLHSGAPRLPSSGPTGWLCVFAAFFGAGLLWKHRKNSHSLRQSM